MPIIEWNVSLLLGIPEVDKHHQRLVQLLNEAYDSFREEQAIPSSVIEEVIDAATDNFARQEGMMAEASYPRLAEHRNEHQVFLRRIRELQKTQKENRNFSIELLWFLCNWVSHHIRETDAELGRFLDGASIRRKPKAVPPQSGRGF